MSKIKRYLIEKYLNWKYRFVDDDLCCCGCQPCHGDSSHSFRSMKEYVISCKLKSRGEI